VTYQAHESVTVIRLLLALSTIALPLGAKLLAHSECIHDICQLENATEVRAKKLLNLQGVAGRGVFA